MGKVVYSEIEEFDKTTTFLEGLETLRTEFNTSDKIVCDNYNKHDDRIEKLEAQAKERINNCEKACDNLDYIKRTNGQLVQENVLLKQRLEKLEMHSKEYAHNIDVLEKYNAELKKILDSMIKGLSFGGGEISKLTQKIEKLEKDSIVHGENALRSLECCALSKYRIEKLETKNIKYEDNCESDIVDKKEAKQEQQMECIFMDLAGTYMFGMGCPSHKKPEVKECVDCENIKLIDAWFGRPSTDKCSLHATLKSKECEHIWGYDNGSGRRCTKCYQIECLKNKECEHKPEPKFKVGQVWDMAARIGVINEVTKDFIIITELKSIIDKTWFGLKFNSFEHKRIRYSFNDPKNGWNTCAWEGEFIKLLS